MAERPCTVLSCCVSLDGYLDGGSERRLVLSSPDDLARVDALRAWSDAILVGAGTVRNDNPRLLVRDPARRRRRRAAGRPESPAKVTLTASGRLETTSNFFTTGEVEKLVYCAPGVPRADRDRLATVATVVTAGDLTLAEVVADLHARGIRRLMVEGGGEVLTQFLTDDLVDELHLAVAPFFVGTSRGHRFVGEGRFPFDAGHRACLAGTVQLGDVVLLRYDLSSPARPAPRRSSA